MNMRMTFSLILLSTVDSSLIASSSQKSEADMNEWVEVSDTAQLAAYKWRALTYQGLALQRKHSLDNATQQIIKLGENLNKEKEEQLAHKEAASQAKQQLSVLTNEKQKLSDEIQDLTTQSKIKALENQALTTEQQMMQCQLEQSDSERKKTIEQLQQEQSAHQNLQLTHNNVRSALVSYKWRAVASQGLAQRRQDSLESAMKQNLALEGNLRKVKDAQLDHQEAMAQAKQLLTVLATEKQKLSDKIQDITAKNQNKTFEHQELTTEGQVQSPIEQSGSKDKKKRKKTVEQLQQEQSAELRSKLLHDELKPIMEKVCREINLFCMSPAVYCFGDIVEAFLKIGTKQ